MADPRFFDRAGPFTLEQLANLGQARLADPKTASLRIDDVAPLDTAGPNQLSFLDNRRYLTAFRTSAAAACIVRPELAAQAGAAMALILSDDPYRTYALCAQAFYPPASSRGGIAPGAHVAADAEIGANTEIAPGAVIESGAEIGPDCCIGPNAVIGRRVRIGQGVRIGANASLSHCLIGNRVTIFPGVRIGQDGFGFAMSARGHVKVPQLGRVIIGDDVEIGANVTIDRGAGPDTVIGPGCMIDNLVQIGHNVQLGQGCVVVAQSGISGSTVLENHVVLAAQAGITGHLRIGTGARIAAQSGVMRDVAAGEQVGGSPAMPIRRWLRAMALLARMAGGKDERGDERNG